MLSLTLDSILTNLINPRASASAILSQRLIYITQKFLNVMVKKIDVILNQVLEKIKPPEEDLKIINNSLKDFLKKLEAGLKKHRINAEVFVGGSFAKNTVIKKDNYDVDVFLRFPDDKNISEQTAKVLKGIDKFSVMHGSRDYFQLKISPDFFIEVVPVKKVKNPKESENITDLSYSHVNYIKKKLKSKKILDEIRIAKAFCYANNCYGAESYIQGFSGYGLELLIYYYGSFLKFIKAMMNAKDKLVIDIEKKFRNKQEILMNINSSKLQSPIVLIDPTYKQRNALAALSHETFEKFRGDCRKFLKTPSVKFFEVKKTDLEKIKQDAKKNKSEFILLEAKTDKQEGDVAGSKLLKFYRHLESEISRFFDIKNKGFDYEKEKSARFFFVVKSKKETLCNGPSTNDKKNIAAFKKRHKHTFIRGKKIFSKEKINFNLKEFIDKWKLKNNGKMKDMSVEELKII